MNSRVQGTLFDRTRWMIAIRIVVLLVMGATGFILSRFYQDPFPRALLTLLILGFAFSSVSLLIQSLFLNDENDRFLSPFSWLQIFWDIGFVAWLVSQTGTVYSPFVSLFGLQITLAAAVRMTSGAILASLCSMLAFMGVCLYQSGVEIFNDPTMMSRFLINTSALLLFGGLLAWFFKNRNLLEQSLKRTRANLRELTEIHSAIVDHIPSGIFYVSADGIVELTNDAALRILERPWSGHRLRGSDLDVFLGRTGRSETSIDVFGRQKKVGFHKTLLPSGHSLIVFQDVTEIRDLESKMRLSERLASAGQLAAGIAHEIRNPLASLSGSIQLLRNGRAEGPEAAQLMKIVIRETDRLDHLISNFLLYARPSELRREPLELRTFIQEIIKLLSNSDEMKNKDLQIELQIPEGVWLNADPHQLKQIYWNLLRNAVQAVESRGKVKIGLVEENERCRFFIEDSGPGIESDLHQKIFDPFFTTKEAGTGLGLSLVYQMVDAHGGRIWVESRAGHGAKFWIEWPSVDISHGEPMSGEHEADRMAVKELRGG